MGNSKSKGHFNPMNHEESKKENERHRMSDNELKRQYKEAKLELIDKRKLEFQGNMLAMNYLQE